MPDLPQFEARAADQGLQPNNIGMEAQAQAGRRVGAFYHQMGQDFGGGIKELGDKWNEHVTFQQISQGMASDATNYNASLQAFAQTLKDPSVDKGDPTLVKTAVDQFKASQDELAKGFTTPKAKEWYLTHSTEQLDQFARTVAGQQSQYAGVQGELNLRQTTNARSQTVNSDPTQLKGALDATELGYKGLAATATINAEAGARVPELVAQDSAKIADAGARGAINLVATKAVQSGLTDPVAVKAQIEDGLKTYMGSDPRLPGLIGEHQAEYDGLVSQASERAVTMVKSQVAAGRQAAEDEGRGQYADIMSQAHTYIRAGKAVPPALIAAGNAWTDKYGKYLPGESETMNVAFDGSITDAASLKFQSNDPRTATVLSQGILIPEGQPGHVGPADIYKAVHVDHTLSPEAGTQLIEAAKAIGDNPQVRVGMTNISEYMKASAAPLLTKSAVAQSFTNPDGSINAAALTSKPVDLAGDHAYGEALREINARYLADVQSGVAPLTAADNLTNPRSPSYFGPRIGELKRNAGPAFDAYVRSHPYEAAPATAAPAAAAPKAGESPKDYLKRTGH